MYHIHRMFAPCFPCIKTSTMGKAFQVCMKLPFANCFKVFKILKFYKYFSKVPSDSADKETPQNVCAIVFTFSDLQCLDHAVPMWVIFSGHLERNLRWKIIILKMVEFDPFVPTKELGLLSGLKCSAKIKVKLMTFALKKTIILNARA